MANKSQTSQRTDHKAPSTPEETQAANKYKEELARELDRELGDNAKDDSTDSEQDETPDSEQDQDVSSEDSKSDTTDSETEESEIEDTETDEVLAPKELRYKEQLFGEKKANEEMQKKLVDLQSRLAQYEQPSKQLTPEEEQILSEKQYLKEKYGLIDKDELESLLSQRFQPIQKKREDEIFDEIYQKFPSLSPEKDPKNDKWRKVQSVMNQIVSRTPHDPYSDYVTRLSWAYDIAFKDEKEKTLETKVQAKAKQNSYASVGGGVSAAKSRTVEDDDKYAHLSPEARAYKQSLEKDVDSYLEKLDKARK